MLLKNSIKIVEARLVGKDNYDLKFFEVITDDPEIRKNIPYIINEEQMELLFLDPSCKVKWLLA